MPRPDSIVLFLACQVVAAAPSGAQPPAAEKPGAVPARLQRWLQPQVWHRDTDGPILSLGEQGSFDDTHMFAPMVVRDADGTFLLYYCGSTGTARDLSGKRVPDNRVFRLGLATSTDGKTFVRHPHGPVLSLAPSTRSVLTPTLLRDAGGRLLRVDGELRMWFTSAAFRGDDRVHAIQACTSRDGISWSKPSARQLNDAYAPTVLVTEGGYRMWYTRPGPYPWNVFHARSADGSEWTVDPEPVLTLSQPWEHSLQIYPHVIEVDGVLLLWYASYASEDHETTAIGFAVSEDGLHWFKHPQNPVLKPDPERPWESHYVSSQSVVRLDDGSFRMFYASRKAPPFVNLYFALNTATWAGPRPQPPAERKSGR